MRPRRRRRPRSTAASDRSSASMPMERFRRMLRQRGPKKAVVAVAKPAQTTTTRHQSQRVTRHALWNVQG